MSQLISKHYLEQQQALHRNPDYGVASLGFAPMVADLVNSLEISDLLDYGCGKGRLVQSLAGKVQRNLTVRCYDPAIPEYATPPAPAQMVVCIDVLEHIESASLNAVLDDLARCTRQYGLFSVHTGPAQKVLDDGRNAHLIQNPPEWWLSKLSRRFDLQTFQRTPNGFYVLVSARAAR
jgi:cyclopropane fatty-acyl-phospholipid synthase-like methyltransferase